MKVSEKEERESIWLVNQVHTQMVKRGARAQFPQNFRLTKS